MPINCGTRDTVGQSLPGRQAAERLLDQPDRPTAVFVGNDFAAVGLMGTLWDRGLRSGHDVAVVAYDAVSIPAELPTALTSVRSPLRTMGLGR